MCDACQKGKQIKIAHKRKNNVSTSTSLELLYMDLFDSSRYVSLNGSKYYFVILNDYIKDTWVFFLKHKDKTLETLIAFYRRVKT